MKLMQMIVVVAVLFSATEALAKSYTCAAKANPNSGFQDAFTIFVDSTSLEGKMVMSVKGVSRELGKISEVGVIDGSDPAQKQAFEATLGMVAEEDVSGMAESDLALVNKIIVYRAEMEGGDEALVYRLNDNLKQMGGTILISGMATACLP